MDETRSSDHLPDSAALDGVPPNRTRNTGAISTGLTPGESQEYPDVPGYEILGVLGHGGMGVVYRARQLKANRLTALKMIRTVEHATPQERLRFQIETEAVARLQHPHIVQLYEVGEVRGQPYFSLEFCDGGTLTEQLKKKPPSPREAAELIETLARAMHYAHLRGVVHRDLKPGNVLLSFSRDPAGERVGARSPAGSRLNDSNPKITDFGLAKRIDAEARDVSKSGAIMGTASYMAPEQAAGKVRDTGPAADVYALGALLYECLTGRPPFEGPQHAVLVRVMSEEPAPPSRLAPKVPRDLETICLKCLSKEPARRYGSAEALADDLRRFQAGEPVQARAVGRLERAVKWARRRPAAAALVGVTALALVALAVLSANLMVARSDAENKRKDAEKQAGIALEKEGTARPEAAKAERASEYLVSIFNLADPQGQGGTMTARQILDAAEKEIPQKLADHPELRDKLLKQIGSVYDRMTATAPLAMILESRGTVQLQSSRDPNQRALPQTLLYTGDRLSLGADAQVQLVVLSDLHKERLRPGTEATIRRKGCEPADAIAERDPDILMTFVRLPKGTFYMGWGTDPMTGKMTQGVKTPIAEDFEIAVHDVTQGQWQAVMGENPSYFSRFGIGRDEVRNISDEELKLFPVESVSWADAQEFIRKLNEKERGSGYLYRLPTEAEWEYACRGGATSEEECSFKNLFRKGREGRGNPAPTADTLVGAGFPRPSGTDSNFYFDKPTNDLSLDQANFNSNIQFNGNILFSHARPTRVGAYPPNKLGLCDMHGNVWQWCADLFNPARGVNRVARGGGWFSFGSECRAATRTSGAAVFRVNDRGFRLARDSVRPQ